MSLSSSIENDGPFKNDGLIEIDNDYSYIKINTDILEKYKTFKSKEIDSADRIYNFKENYYVLISHSVLNNEPAFIAFDAEFNIVRDAEVLPGYKIDYSKLSHMTDIETIMFVNDENEEMNFDLSRATPIPITSSTSTDGQLSPKQLSPKPLKSLKTPLSPISQSEQSEDLSQDDQLGQYDDQTIDEVKDFESKVKVKFSSIDEKEISDDQEQEEEQQNDDFQDFLDQLMSGEVVETKQVSGTERQTFEINPNDIKNLLKPSGNEFIDEINGRYLINMQKISEAYTHGLNSSLGKLFLTVKGLPKWIMPVVNGKFSTNSAAYSALNEPSFEVISSPEACSFSLDNIIQPMYTGYQMDSDKPLELPGSWKKARTDFTIAAFANTGKGKDIKPIKLPGAIYNSVIKLTAEAQARLATKASKSGSMYVRMLTLPKAVKGVDIELQQAMNSINISGFKINKGYTLHGAFKDLTFIPVQCKDDRSHEDYISSKLSEIIPTIDNIVETARSNTNLASYLKLLKIYGYDRNDLSLKNYLYIGLKTSAKLKSLNLKLKLKLKLNEDWAVTHFDTIAKFNRVLKLKPHLLIPVDNGKYNTYEQLLKYLIHVQHLKCEFNAAKSLKALEQLESLSIKKPLRTDSMHIEANAMLFKDDLTNSYYTAENYNMLNFHRLQVKLANALTLSRETLESERLNLNLETMRLALETLEKHHKQANKGILDNLKSVLTGDNLKSSATFDMLMSFDTRDIIGQIKFIKHMDLFIDSKVILLNSEMQYFIQHSKEIICCKHIIDELKNLPLDEYALHGHCRYCGAIIANEVPADDYGQIQFMTTRDMFTQGEDTSAMFDASEATLKHFLKHSMTIIMKIIEFKLSPTDISDIIEATIKYIKENNPSSKEPYGSFASKIPTESITNDLRLVLLYNKQFDEENSQQLFVIKGKAATITPAFGSILSYFRENSLDATNLNENEVFSAMRAADKKIKGNGDGVDVESGTQKETMQNLGQKNLVFNYMYNLLVLNKHSFNLACLIAHVNLSVNLIYKNTVKLDHLITSDNIYTICNLYHPYMRTIINEHMANLLKSDQKSQKMIDPFTNYLKLFTAPFSKTLYNLKLTSSIPVEDKSMQYFSKVHETLVLHNSSLYENFHGLSLNLNLSLKSFNFVNVIPEIEFNGKIKNISDYMECWASNQFKAQEYGVSISQHYEAVNDGIDTVEYIPLMPGRLAKVKLTSMFNDVQELTENNASISEITFRAALCSSVILLDRKFTTADGDQIAENYKENERTLSQHAPPFDFSKIDDEICSFNVSAPLRNPSLQTNLTYTSSCLNLDKSAKIKTVIHRQLVDEDLSVRTQFLSKAFTENFKKLITYKNMMGYTETLNQFFDEQKSSAKWLKNFIVRNAIDSILNTDHQKLLDDRKYIPALSSSLNMVNFNFKLDEEDEKDDQDQDDQDLNDYQDLKDDPIIRRKIFRTQKNGKTLTTIIQWLTKPLSRETLKQMEANAELSKSADLSGSTKFVIDKELASTEGYILIELIKIKQTMLDWKEEEDLHLTDYKPAIPEIYNMSFCEYVKILERLKIDDESTIENFHNVLYAALRLDIILHVQKLVNWQLDTEDGGEFLLTDDNIRVANEQNDLNPIQNKFIETVNLILSALSNIRLDHNVKSFTELYEARTRKYMEQSKTIRQPKTTGFEDAEQDKSLLIPDIIVDENQIQEEQEENLDDNQFQADDEDVMDDAEEGFGNTIGGEVDD